MQSAEEMLRRLSDPETKHQLDLLHHANSNNNVNVQEVHDTTRDIVAGQVDKPRNCEQSLVKLDEKKGGFGLNQRNSSSENLRTKQSRNRHQQHLASSQFNQKAN